VAFDGLAGVDSVTAARIGAPVLLAEDGNGAPGDARRLVERLRPDAKRAWLLLATGPEGFAPAPRAQYLHAAEVQFLRETLLR